MASLKWVCYRTGERIPENVVLGGHRCNREDLYVCRATVSGTVTPGKLEKESQRILIPYGGKEHVMDSGEVLTCDKPDLLSWVSASDGKVPTGGIVAGIEADNGNLFVGRATQSSELIPGKIYDNHGVCYVGTNWQEFAKNPYEALVVKYTYPPKE